MEFVLAFLKVINPIEWLKEAYRMPKYVKLTALIVCSVIFLFAPNSYREISLILFRKICLCLTPIFLICFIGECYQEKHLKKQKEEERLRQKELEEQRKREQEQAEIKERNNNLLEYYKMFDLCDCDERQILIDFYKINKTSIIVSQTQSSYIRAMNAKGMDFINSTYISGEVSYKAFISTSALELINRYFDRDKDKYFKFFDSLDKREKEVLEVFAEEEWEEIIPATRLKKAALRLINKIQKQEIGIAYWNREDKSAAVSSLLLAYIIRYFNQT